MKITIHTGFLKKIILHFLHCAFVVLGNKEVVSRIHTLTPWTLKMSVANVTGERASLQDVYRVVVRLWLSVVISTGVSYVNRSFLVLLTITTAQAKWSSTQISMFLFMPQSHIHESPPRFFYGIFSTVDIRKSNIR